MSTHGTGGMSNGARHAIGAVLGLVLTPVIAGLMVYGVDGLRETYARFDWGDRFIPVVALIVAALALGVLIGPRMSGLAALIPGLVYTLSWLIRVVAPEWSLNTLDEPVPDEIRAGYSILIDLGIFGVIGIALLMTAVAPSRWARRVPRQPRQPRQPQYAPPQPGQWPPPHHVPGRQLGGPNQPPYPQQPPVFGGASDSERHAPPPAGRPEPFGPPAPPPAPAQEPPRASGGGPDDDEPGEWTRMYGGPGGDRPQS